MHNIVGDVLCKFTKMIKYIISRKSTLKITESPEELRAVFTTDDYIARSCGYDLERGVKGSTAEHLSVAEYKLKKTQEQLTRSEQQLQEIESIDNISAKNLPLNTVALKRSDYDKLKASAEAYITTRDTAAENETLKGKVEALKTENAELRHENGSLNDQLIKVPSR